jgi:hypothetical protein
LARWRCFSGSSGDTNMKHAMIPVWFFVGILLAIYGILILASGLAEYGHPAKTVLGELHAPIWWGGVLAVVGIVYSFAFRPKRGR